MTVSLRSRTCCGKYWVTTIARCERCGGALPGSASPEQLARYDKVAHLDTGPGSSARCGAVGELLESKVALARKLFAYTSDPARSDCTACLWEHDKSLGATDEQSGRLSALELDRDNPK